MNLIIFERTNFAISEQNKYTFSYRVIKADKVHFQRFLNELIERSKQFKTFINLYRVYKDKTVNKIAWIKCGELFTL